MAVHYFDPNGVDSLRDNGYRDTAMALAELIDNSIQAEANKIEIILVEKLSKTSKKEFLVDEIIVVDNGVGMNKETLETSLRFGGGTRHGAKKGLGKFGMGLPNSSASQCPRFEVYSWKDPNKVYFNYFDFKEIKENASEYLPDVVESKIPSHINFFVSPLYNHGTIVRWVNCDRVIFRRSKKLVPHIIWPLGRIFRYFINDQHVEIKVRVIQYNGHDFSENFALARVIKPIDPLFLMQDTQLDNPYNAQPLSEAWEEGEFLFPDPNGNSTNKLLFNKIGDCIKIKASIAKKETKRLGGSSYIGDIYEEFMGISVVRAGREIKLDTFGFIGDISEQTHRWWKIELNFDPTFDSYFGLDNTKQNVHAFKKIIDKDELEKADDDFQLEFICELSGFIENQIREMKKKIDLIDAGSRGKGNKEKDQDDNDENPDSGPFPEDAVPVPNPGDKGTDLEEDIKDQEREELKKWLLLRYTQYANDEVKLNLAIDWFFTHTHNQVIVFLQLGAAELYNFQPIGHRTIIEINTQHDFYLEFIRPIFDEDDINKIEPLLLLFGAMVEAEKGLVSYHQYISRFRSLFAVKLNQFILDWKENK